MKFLTEFHLSFLDEMISPSLQSILFEVLFWTVCYMVFANVSAKRVRTYLRNFDMWEIAKKRNGIFCGNGQDDTVLFVLLMCHHGLAGSLMVLGYATGDPSLFRHGYLCETGFEIADIIAILLPMYPYKKYDGMKSELKAAMVFHHLPGTSLAIPVIMSGLYENENLQAIAIALLIGAAISMVFGQYMYTLDLDKQMKYATFVFVCNVGFFLYCRWYVFPKHSYLFIQDVLNSQSTSSPIGIPIQFLYAAGGIFSLFNIAISIDIVPMTIRYIKRCFDGVTPLDDKPVPSSRDSMVMKSYQRGSYTGRRSSILDLVASSIISDESDDGDNRKKQRRSSTMAAVLHMATLDDMITIDDINGRDKLDPSKED